MPSLTRLFLTCGLLASLGACDRQSGADKQLAQAMQSPAAEETAASGADSAETPPGEIDRSHKGSRLPDLSFHTASDKEIRTISLLGKPLLINLWATWCGPCVAELPTLDKLAERGTVQVLTISQDTGAADKVAAFLQAKGLAHLDPWLDPRGAAASQWQVSTLPATIYYDAKGRELWRSNGGQDWTSPAAAKLLAEAK